MAVPYSLSMLRRFALRLWRLWFWPVSVALTLALAGCGVLWSGSNELRGWAENHPLLTDVTFEDISENLFGTTIGHRVVARTASHADATVVLDDLRDHVSSREIRRWGLELRWDTEAGVSGIDVGNSPQSEDAQGLAMAAQPLPSGVDERMVRWGMRGSNSGPRRERDHFGPDAAAAASWNDEAGTSWADIVRFCETEDTCLQGETMQELTGRSGIVAAVQDAGLTVALTPRHPNLITVDDDPAVLRAVEVAAPLQAPQVEFTGDAFTVASDTPPQDLPELRRFLGRIDSVVYVPGRRSTFTATTAEQSRRLLAEAPTLTHPVRLSGEASGQTKWMVEDVPGESVRRAAPAMQRVLDSGDARIWLESDGARVWLDDDPDTWPGVLGEVRDMWDDGHWSLTVTHLDSSARFRSTPDGDAETSTVAGDHGQQIVEAWNASS